VLGGTFDPLHIAHLVAAGEARHALQLDRVLFVVANVPWQKLDRGVTAAEDRFAMVAAAVDGLEGFEASRLELDRGGESYTADTLAELRDRLPAAELFLLVGADVAADLHTWKRVEEVRSEATLGIWRREGIDVPNLGPEWRVVTVDVPCLELSSTELRSRAAAGHPLDWLVPAPAVRLIRERGLYARGR
jgi:nicotinate-nucleotide adenylyltransferase